MSGKSKLMAARGKAMSAESANGQAATTDEQLDKKRQERGYNPIDDAERGNVSQKLNSDAEKYRKGPGPL